MSSWQTIILCFQVCFLGNVDLLENGLARTPPMGWMSWVYYMCGVKCTQNPDKCLDEKLILSVADAFYNEGYQEAGYEYIIIDDCWSEKTRDEFGNLVPDKVRFPRGLKYLADYIHKRGLKFGMYANIAKVTCMGYPGSRDHFARDMQLFASWDVDYIKVDGCFVSEEFLNTAYIKLGKNINESGRPMVYSCSWPYYSKYIHEKNPNLTQISSYCNLWRNYHDVTITWDAIKAITHYYKMNYNILVPHHGPGHWNDPDMLILGNGALTESQSRVHMAVYAMLAAPLIMSCNMAKITPYEKSLLQNMELISINQDALGILGRPYDLSPGVVLWVKPRFPRMGDIYPSFSFAIVNMALEERTVPFIPGQYGLNSTGKYIVMDVFSTTFLRNVTINDHMFVMVPPEDAVIYTLYPL